MKKLLIGSILSVAFACGLFFYMKSDSKRFVDSLPQPPVVEETVDIRSPSHPDKEPLPSKSSTARIKSASGAEGNAVSTSTEQVSEEDSAPVDAAEETEGISQTGTASQTDDAHEDQSAPSPFAKKSTRVEDMDPDEVADMMIIGLIQRFGDIPEVHTLTALTRKKLKNQPLTLDEHIDYTAAQYHLWPDPRTKKTLDIFLEKRATESSNSTKIVR